MTIAKKLIYEYIEQSPDNYVNIENLDNFLEVLNDYGLLSLKGQTARNEVWEVTTKQTYGTIIDKRKAIWKELPEEMRENMIKLNVANPDGTIFNK